MFITQCFPPEIAAGAVRTFELARLWKERGNEVTVITEIPCFPYGIIPKEYQGKYLLKEDLFGIKVIRTWIFPAPNKGSFKRLLYFLSFVLSSILGSFLTKKCDIVIATSPQLFIGISGWVISRLKGCPFVFEVRDLWPTCAVELGMIRNRFIIRLLEGLEGFLYKKAQKVIVIAKRAKHALVDKGIPEGHIEVIPNGVDINLFKPVSKDQEIIKRYGLDGKFVVSYIGTHGLSHGLSSILDVAKDLKEREDILFLFIGEGAEKKELLEKKRRLGLENVLFLEERERAEIPKFINTTDLCIVHLKKIKAFERTIPSKVFEIMGCGRPIICGVDGETWELVERAKAGIYVEPENVIQMKEVILNLYENRKLIEELGSNGRRFVVENFDRKKLAERYERVLKEVLL